MLISLCNDGVKFKRVFDKYDQAFPRLCFSFLTYKIKPKHFCLYNKHFLSIHYLIFLLVFFNTNFDMYIFQMYNEMSARLN